MKVSVLIALMAILVSCKSNRIETPERPDDLISQNKMVDLIYDIAIINAAKGVNKKLLESKGVNPQEYVFKKHDVDSVRFAKSNAYYAHDLKTYEEIYNRVRVRLNKDRTHYNTLAQEEMKRQDSINKARRDRMDSIRRQGQTADPAQIKFESGQISNRLKRIDSSGMQIP